jgi:hypothetical protein
VPHLSGDTNKVLHRPMCTHKFFGIYSGMEGGPYLNFKTTSLYEWIGPICRETNLIQPHLKIYMTTRSSGEDNGLAQSELSVIMNAFYNRVYQKGYEEHSVFPVSFS